MSQRHVVVDGSNIATEGRALPSLSQLRDAVAAWKAENPDDEVTVVVDASFSYRIDESERADFELSRTTGELVSPPAGAIGRGDGFLLQIADRIQAVVLSNDSFQEYHGEYAWLFERGRLIGGTPVPGVGWIFSLRTPVRGPKSRESIKEAKKKGRKAKPIEEAIAEATEDVLEPAGASDDGDGRKRRRRRRGGGGAPPPETVNDPAPFIRFITTYKLGSPVRAVVDRFSSHGAFVIVDDTTCYVPLTAMGSPPPRAAREVMKKGETREFVVQALDAQRRGVELALPGFERIGGGPTEETVEAEIREERQKARKKAASSPPTPAPSRPAKKAATKQAPAGKKAAAKKAAGKKAAATPVAKPAAKKAAVKKPAATAEKAPAKAQKAAPKPEKARAGKDAAKKAAKAPTKTPSAKKAKAAAARPEKAPAMKKRPSAPDTKPAAKKAPAAKKSAKKSANR